MNKEGFGIRFLYHTFFGRIVLKVLTKRFVSRLVGSFLSTRFSKVLIGPFVKKNDINLEEYYQDFHNFNDFFSRKVREEYRPIDCDDAALISPSDGFLSAYEIQEGLVLPVKHSYYSISSLLQNEELVLKYKDGICVVLRLCVNHYHRYCYLDDGFKEENVSIAGKLHTVRPIALEKYPVFTSNAREYCVLHTKHFGDVTQVEVGALFVGKIKNFHETYTFSKGEYKGTFLFGGSTIILLFEKDKVYFPKKYFEDTKNGKENLVKMGEKIGKSI